MNLENVKCMIDQLIDAEIINDSMYRYICQRIFEVFNQTIT